MHPSVKKVNGKSLSETKMSRTLQD